MLNTEDLPECIKKMRAASTLFYDNAIHAGNHAFIEFTGLMNEYIKLCEDSMKAGINFTEANKHTGTRMPVAPYRLEYLKEKLECIFEGIELKAKEKIVTIIDKSAESKSDDSDLATSDQRTIR